MPWYAWVGLMTYGAISFLIATGVYLMANPSTDSRLWEAFKAFWLWLPWLIRESFRAIIN